jgi:hypothetical protein
MYVLKLLFFEQSSSFFAVMIELQLVALVVEIGLVAV